mmetsp:Transcript_523/g.1153  ORF Transcript_523/g.1153 Transcript_523/m.1153 type:complete len:389 (-) Transcript_523:1517-2683(-)
MALIFFSVWLWEHDCAHHITSHHTTTPASQPDNEKQVQSNPIQSVSTDRDAPPEGYSGLDRPQGALCLGSLGVPGPDVGLQVGVRQCRKGPQVAHEGVGMPGDPQGRKDVHQVAQVGRQVLAALGGELGDPHRLLEQLARDGQPDDVQPGVAKGRARDFLLGGTVFQGGVFLGEGGVRQQEASDLLAPVHQGDHHGFGADESRGGDEVAPRLQGHVPDPVHRFVDQRQCGGIGSKRLEGLDQREHVLADLRDVLLRECPVGVEVAGSRGVFSPGRHVREVVQVFAGDGRADIEDEGVAAGRQVLDGHFRLRINAALVPGGRARSDGLQRRQRRVDVFAVPFGVRAGSDGPLGAAVAVAAVATEHPSEVRVDFHDRQRIGHGKRMARWH